MRTQPHWRTSTAPERPFWQDFLLMIFAPWIEQRFFSIGERFFIGGLVWFIAIFQMVLPITILFLR